MGLPPRDDNDLDRELARQRRKDAVTAAGLLLRHGDQAGALTQCQALLAADPEDPDAHELLGDILAAQGRWRQAVVEFQHTLQADPGRVSAERKLAEASLGQAGLRNVAFTPDEPAIPRKPGTASALSFFFPGLGQLYNRQIEKGALAVAGGVTLALIIMWGLVMWPLRAAQAAASEGSPTPAQTLAGWSEALAGMGAWGKMALLVACILWLCLHVWSIFDAARGAQKTVAPPKAL